MSGDYSLWKQQEARREANKGITGRGFVGCINILVSGGIAYAVWEFFLKARIDLRTELSLPPTWPEAAVTALAVVILFVGVLLAFTVLLSLVWKLTGKDQKVSDKLEEMADTWDQL
jgi:TRAP-type C4-dicarboxylate transport system permease small subunit